MKSIFLSLSLLFATIAGAAPSDQMLYFGPFENELAQIERDVPGFAGWYFEKDGTPVVRVKHADRKDATIERVARVLAKHPRGRRGTLAGQVHGAIVAKPARYSFSELAAYRAALMSDLPADVHSIDLDEVGNVVTLLVSEEASIGAVRSVAARLRVPEDALRVAAEPAPVTRSDLYSYQRPLHGGWSFYFMLAGIMRRCTIGLPGKYTPPGTYNTQHGFLTASHCTQVSFGSTGTAAYQPDYLSVATETVDPPVFTNTYPCNYTGTMRSPCRWSDTAFYQYADSNAYDPATIAETSTYGYLQAAPSPTWDVIGTQYASGQVQTRAVNDWVDKIGSTTGWTYGQITATCVTVLPAGSTVWRICNDRSNIYSEAGDSGSPIFVWYSDHVDWAGILWGGTSTYTLHSPVWAIEADMPGFQRY